MKLFQFISVSVYFQHFEDILKIPWYADNFGHHYCDVKCSHRYIPSRYDPKVQMQRLDDGQNIQKPTCFCFYIFLINCNLNTFSFGTADGTK